MINNRVFIREQTVRLFTGYTPQELARACNAHAKDNQLSLCPIGAVFVCPLTGMFCENVTDSDWERVIELRRDNNA